MDRFLAVIKKLLTLFVKLFTGVCYLVLLFFFVQVFLRGMMCWYSIFLIRRIVGIVSAWMLCDIT